MGNAHLLFNFVYLLFTSALSVPLWFYKKLGILLAGRG